MYLHTYNVHTNSVLLIHATYISFMENSGSVSNNFKIRDTEIVNVYFHLIFHYESNVLKYIINNSTSNIAFGLFDFGLSIIKESIVESILALQKIIFLIIFTKL